MFNSKIHIEAGDVVIIYMTRDSMLGVTIKAGDVLHNKYGRYPHDSMIGMKYGSKMHSPHPHPGYVHLLRPTPELWTLSLPHRTQILYNPDISYISMRLGVRPGVRIVEAGTGSGSMTHALSRSVGGRGKVYSFEYHLARFEKAKLEFDEHRLGNVELRHRNVCKDGFDGASNVAAVFLDLPAPWEAIPHAVKTLDPNQITRICCFSPCLEQVLKTVSALRSEGFEDVTTKEVLVRTHDLIPPPPAGSSHLHDVTSIVRRMKEHETKKAERRIIQMKTAREKAQRQKEKRATQASEALGGEARSKPVEETAGAKRSLEEAGEDQANKRMKVEPAAEQTLEGGAASVSLDITTDTRPVESADAAVADEVDIDAEEEEETDGKPFSVWSEPPSTSLLSSVLTKPAAEMRGHTSYLTFACFYPATVRQQLAAQDTQRGANGADAVKAGRVGELRKEAQKGSSPSARAASEETEYGDVAMDAAMGTMTEEEIMKLSRS